MRQGIQLAPNSPAVFPDDRLARLSGAPVGRERRSSLEIRRGVVGLGLMIWLACSGAPVPPQAPTEENTQAPVEESSQSPVEEEIGAFIVQGTDLATALEAVRKVGGEVTHELGVIRAVGARLTESQRAALEGFEGITRIYEDRPVSTQQAPSRGDAPGHLESGE